MIAAALPYVAPPSGSLPLPLFGELPLTVFGPLVALGGLVGGRRCLRYAHVHGIAAEDARTLMERVLLGVHLGLDWRRAPPGRLTGVVAVGYAVVRFTLDFFRAVAPAGAGTPDPRYLGLTPAQYATIAFFGAGLWLLWHRPPDDSRGQPAPRSSTRPPANGPTTACAAARGSNGPADER